MRKNNDANGVQELIKFCIKRKALMFGDFTLKNGRKSPVFFNIFFTINDAAGLDFISKQYASLIMDFLQDAIVGQGKTAGRISTLQDHVFLFGPAYKGIPIAAIAADCIYREQGLSFRWGYDRKEAKTHGEKSGANSADSLLDADLRNGDQVIIIDDILTEGTAKMEAIDKVMSYAAAKKIDVKIIGIATFIDRWEGGKELREKFPVRACLRMDDVAQRAFNLSLISKEDLDRYTTYFAQYKLS